jgi:hypothetical protein
VIVPVLDAHGKPLRRPVVYLDTSTLGDAFPGAFEPCPELTEAVTLAASRGILCLSVAQIIEVTALQPLERSLWMGRWLDSLERHWLSVTTAAGDELTYAVSADLGLTNDPPRLPIYHTMIGGFGPTMEHLTPPATVPILEDPTGLRWCYGKHGEEVSTGHRSKKRPVYAVLIYGLDHGCSYP